MRNRKRPQNLKGFSYVFEKKNVNRYQYIEYAYTGIPCSFVGLGTSTMIKVKNGQIPQPFGIHTKMDECSKPEVL